MLRFEPSAGPRLDIVRDRIASGIVRTVGGHGHAHTGGVGIARDTVIVLDTSDINLTSPSLSQDSGVRSLDRAEELPRMA
jgi:hypothetical protein